LQTIYSTARNSKNEVGYTKINTDQSAQKAIFKKSLINLKPIENKTNERSLSTNNFSGMPKISPKNIDSKKINEYFAIKMNAELSNS
jgi:hypothetical protein